MIKPTFTRTTRPTFQDLLADWVDPDIAMFYLTIALGMTDFNDDGWLDVKGVFNTNNVVSTSLFHLLEQFAKEGLLETNDDDQFRWNKEYEKDGHFELLRFAK